MYPLFFGLSFYLGHAEHWVEFPVPICRFSPVIYFLHSVYIGLPWWFSSNESTSRTPKRWEFSPWVGKIPWRRAWQPTPVLLPGKAPQTEKPGGIQSMRSQRVGHDWSDWAHTHCIHANLYLQIHPTPLSSLVSKNIFYLYLCLISALQIGSSVLFILDYTFIH